MVRRKEQESTQANLIQSENGINWEDESLQSGGRLVKAGDDSLTLS